LSETSVLHIQGGLVADNDSDSKRGQSILLQGDNLSRKETAPITINVLRLLGRRSRD